jgi:hypothetical protein
MTKESKMDRFFWWLNDHDEARLGIVMVGGPGASFFLTQPSGWIEIAVGMTLLTATIVFTFMWNHWVNTH